MKTIHLQYQGEDVTVEVLALEGDIQYKVHLDHPIFLEKDEDEDGVEYWLEVGQGPTLRAEEIGEMIDDHPELI